ncbi:uncharacterized protein OCT59_012707 [Rhizophagus irregularis]|uniref:F-box domain-containing protein n=1 Tax=Rhizophagus irregularis (strain DAOM 197198w) TaxID=1432141 RepID=A0A015JWI1_RHIIW|nr:hypothetical protein RirG_056000 [Rhizophagus irregularis DAOM 197198w]UZO20281.1 hypothetical protein OCT59_012707 [Rhizophagus irregularis]
MSKLNKDILFLIFEELQDDPKSLFSCLMVNRLWCENAIPILWKNPWCYNDINYNNKNYLFIIIASYLPDNIKESISKLGIQLPSFSYQSLLFDYLSFCRSININTINTIICIGSPLTYNQFLLQREFYDLFTKKFLELKYLDLKSIKHQIFYFPEASRFRFESLCELKCDTSTESSFFYGLAHFSQYIQRLIIDNNIFSKVDFGITKLIEVQKNLKYFEWNDISTNSNVRKNPYKEILLALGKKADNINHLKLFFMYPDCTLQKVFPNFHKLKTLIINRFNDFNEDQLRMCVYRDLEILYINHYELKAASIIIENSGEHLKKIYIDQNYNHRFHHDNFEEYSLILIRKIYKNCSSIEYLCLPYYPSMDHFIEIEKLLKVCQNLKTLLIYKIMNEIETEGKLLNNGEELLKILIKSTPTNLREIVFLYDFNFSLEVLEKFLGKWKGHALSILTITNPAYKAENYVKLINKYKNDGVIKDFRHESYKNAVNIVKINFKI